MVAFVSWETRSELKTRNENEKEETFTIVSVPRSVRHTVQRILPRTLYPLNPARTRDEASSK